MIVFHYSFLSPETFFEFALPSAQLFRAGDKSELHFPESLVLAAGAARAACREAQAERVMPQIIGFKVLWLPGFPALPSMVPQMLGNGLCLFQNCLKGKKGRKKEKR